MKRCLACENRYASPDWTCPRCGHQPDAVDGFFSFCDDSAEGFRDEFFGRLAQLEGSNFWFSSRNRLICWALNRFFPNAGSLLEVGCGTGFVTTAIRGEMPQIRLVASERSVAGLRFARQRLPGVELYQMDIRSLPFEEEFDVIGAFDVLEHVAEDTLALDELFRAACVGGGILLTVPQHRFLWSDLDRHAMHQRRYTRRELRQKIAAAGFRIEWMTSFVTFLLPAMIFSRFTRHHAGDVWDEFSISRTLNIIFKSVLEVERVVIKRGFSLPIGGSLMVIARRIGLQ